MLGAERTLEAQTGARCALGHWVRPRDRSPGAYFLAALIGPLAVRAELSSGLPEAMPGSPEPVVVHWYPVPATQKGQAWPPKAPAQATLSCLQAQHCTHWILFLFFGFFCLFVCFFPYAPTAYGSSQTRGQIRATAASLHHSSWPHWILNPLNKARNWTCVLMDISKVHYRRATTGTPVLM